MTATPSSAAASALWVLLGSYVLVLWVISVIVYALQDEITQEIVTALEVTLTDGEQARIWRHRAGSADVYDHFIRGRELYFSFSRATNAQARAEFEKAIAINPDRTRLRLPRLYLRRGGSPRMGLGPRGGA